MSSQLHMLVRSRALRLARHGRSIAVSSSVLSQGRPIQAQRSHGAPALRASSQSAVEPQAQNERSERSQELYLHNSMTRRKELFVPRNGNLVSMYVCGVTVYDLSHIGHARVYVAFDILLRVLRNLGFEVDYVRNFTDIDDKIIKRANESGEDPLALSARFIKEFHEDVDALACLRPAREPKATDHVADMVATISTIIANGHAYVVENDVFFDVASLPGYGRLSGQTLDGGVAGGSDRVAVDQRKRHPADFALWKSAKPGEPVWDSPWGPGRPGWHIECSSMIRALMGPVIDIHGGGQDLMFPHHENELAQSQAAARCSCDADHLHEGRDFVRYWLHNGFVNIDTEKMSKSLGNFFTIREVLKLYHPMALRWFLINTQYRQPVNYTQRSLEEASDRLYYICDTLQNAVATVSADGDAEARVEEAERALASTSGHAEAAAAWRKINLALLDDLNTPLAVACLSEPLKLMNDLMFTKAGKKAKGRLDSLAAYAGLVRASLQILGIDVTRPEQMIADLRALALVRAGLTEDDILAAIAMRAEVRAAKDFKRADEIRVEYANRGIGFQDTPTGTTWRPLVPDVL